MNKRFWFARVKILGVFYYIPVASILRQDLQDLEAPLFFGTIFDAWSSERMLNKNKSG